MNREKIVKYALEMFGTFLLVLVGTGAVVYDQQHDGHLGILGIAIAFGAVIALCIILFAHRCHAHINPAVTIASAISNDCKKELVIPYIIFQTIGAILGSVAVKLLSPTNLHLGKTVPSVGLWETFVIEFAMTFLLMIFILISRRYDKGKIEYLTATIVGIGIIPLILYSGPLTGGSFNPARSIGPAIISGDYQALWIYLSAPTLAAITAVLFWGKLVKNKKTPAIN